ncbi:DUF5658 family protein (plasmid) [Aneurinibacillus sp. Ricciae_BoGa-3]|uniref:DUF5658 family protein n=1 Tax=Aneurinibacillus sp. Ricciae_BoGa-3 TaxID=3022697 RepID=UPI002341D1D2|nr:DUF5658 family protein [Aneurinibacillus sp. Ricciae_BoGa-3]WCK57326.1 DUF5658 family protein [Aneurinibacillus sp. Ricciae_BoGa-3]
MVKWLLLLSFLDAYFTDIGVASGVIQEGNPIAKFLYEKNVVLFYGWKMLLPIVLLFLYPKIKDNNWLRRAVYFVCGIYILLFVYHLIWFSIAVF